MFAHALVVRSTVFLGRAFLVLVLQMAGNERLVHGSSSLGYLKIKSLEDDVGNGATNSHVVSLSEL